MLDLDGTDALLLVGDSERSADMLYATGFSAPDPFVFLQTNRANYLLIGDLELDRARDQARVDEVLSLSRYDRLAADRLDEAADEEDYPTRRYRALLMLLEELKVRSMKVPADFPVGAADILRQAGLRLEVAAEPLFAHRSRKQPVEIDAVVQALVAAERGMKRAIEIIRSAAVDSQDRLVGADGQILTSQGVRRLIHQSLLADDCTGQHTIVACGEDGCDPHQQGSGPLLAGQPIILDIFPRSEESGYFGDITRTVLKGEASSRQRDLYRAVEEGQQLALERIRAGVDGSDIHRAIEALFTDRGFKTGERNGRMQGFFHGTGHGLGLEIHEAPSIGKRRDILQVGQVVTVEPGLYYQGLGGVR
ncbi:MAG TPA: aminopeptidase P family protein, partial [Candidatus Latescibacteria bacterium]|nr:aminopeptidase P family protein [Candidatus Latescibacterota bacterium]